MTHPPLSAPDELCGREAIERITLAAATREEGVQKEARAAKRSAMSDFSFNSAREWATVPSIRLDDLQFLLADRTALMAWKEEAEKVRARIAEEIDEGSGFWRACSGCQESCDGSVSIIDYPRSDLFQCQPGGGCSECGGIGVIWDDIDYDAMAREMIADDLASKGDGAK